MISDAFATNGGGDPNFLGTLLFFAGLFALMYFLFIRPQQKRAKEHKNMTEALQNGDEVILAGGIFAKIQKLEEQYATVEIAKGVEIRVQRNAVQALLPKGTLSD